MPAARVEAVGGVAGGDGYHEAYAPRRDGQELRVDAGVAEAGDDGGREEGEAALGYHVGDVGQVVQQHARGQARVADLAARGVGLDVAAASGEEAVDGEFLVGCGEPFCQGGVVGKVEPEEEGGEEGYYALGWGG